MSMTWKPCDKLTASDFEISPVWGFDLSREGVPEGADETWVRPYSLTCVPEVTDLLFVRADLEQADRGVVAGAVTFRFLGKCPHVEGVVLLEPAYCALRLHEGVVPARERGYVDDRVPNARDLFPLKYEAVLRVGDKHLPLRGMAHLAW
jgi:hypothetical protein